MFARIVISAVASAAFVSLSLAAAADEAQNPTGLAALTMPSAALLQQGARAVPDLRSLLADPAIRNAVGLSENSWDFSIPDGVPGFGPILAADRPGTTTLSCAERDRHLITAIEDRGSANDIASDRLAEAGFSMLQARGLCSGGRETEALALYDRTLQGLSSQRASR